MTVRRVTTCDSCGTDISFYEMPVCLSSGSTFHFCDLNCVEYWLKSRFRQKQGDKMAITTIDAKTLS